MEHGVDVGILEASVMGLNDKLTELIASGADVNKQDYTESTPLCYAARSNHVEIIHSLVDAGADINLPTMDGNTPLHIAVIRGNQDAVKALIENAGKTPAERVAFAFELATARKPSESELAVMTRVFDQQFAEYQADLELAQALLDVGETKPNPDLDTAELAAYTTVASMILNLDETITRS